MDMITVTITEVDGASRPKSDPKVSRHRRTEPAQLQRRAVQRAYGKHALLRLDDFSACGMTTVYGEIYEPVGLYARRVLVGRVRVEVQL
jgi:hypothetical protein